MKLVEPISRLKELDFQSFVGKGNGMEEAPYITKSIINPDPKYGLNLQVQRRLDDVQRLTKFFFTGRGAKFLAGEAALNASKTQGKLIDRIVGALGRTGRTSITVLGQAGLSGTGTRLTPPDNSTYLGQNQAPLIKGNPILNLLGDPVSRRPFPVDTVFTYGTFGQGSLSRIVDREGYESATREPVDERPNTAYTKKGTQADFNIRLKLGEGLPSFTPMGKDALNAIDITTTPLATDYEIIPFEFAIYDPKEGTPDYIYLRAYLQNFSDTFNGKWNGTKYIGRAEELFTYTGFSRNIGFSLKVAALTRAELDPIYKKLNRLAGSTAPSYSNSFLRGVFTKLTIGDYLKTTPGFFTSVSLTWQISYPWEIGVNKEDERDIATRVPVVLDVDFQFTPVHNFVPEYGETFFARPNELVGFTTSSADVTAVNGADISSPLLPVPTVPREFSYIGENAEQLQAQDRARAARIERLRRQEAFERSIDRQEV